DFRGTGRAGSAAPPPAPVGLRTHESLLITLRRPAGPTRGGIYLTERTLVLVKPDGVRRGLIGDVLSRIERKGLRIIAMDLRMLDTGIAQTHYAEHSGKPFFGPLVDFITSGPLVALVAEGPRAIEAFRGIAGATDPVCAT